MLVFDDADLEREQLEKYWPTSAKANSRILVTSRVSDFKAADHSLELGAFDSDSGAGLLRSLLTGQSSDQEDSVSAQYLSEQLGGIPLALAMSAGHMERQNMTIDAYLSEMMDIRHRATLGPGYNYSLQILQNAIIGPLSDQAKDVLYAFAFLDADAVDESLLLSYLDDFPDTDFSWKELHIDEFELILEELVSHCLIMRGASPSGASCSMHRLIQEHILRNDGTQIIFDRVTEMLLRLYEEPSRAGETDIAAWSILSTILPHVSRLVECLERGCSWLQGSSRFVQLVVDAGAVQLFDPTKRDECTVLLKMAKKLLQASDAAICNREDVLKHIENCLELYQSADPLEPVRLEACRKAVALRKNRILRR